MHVINNFCCWEKKHQPLYIFGWCRHYVVWKVQQTTLAIFFTHNFISGNGTRCILYFKQIKLQERNVLLHYFNVQIGRRFFYTNTGGLYYPQVQHLDFGVCRFWTGLPTSPDQLWFIHHLGWIHPVLINWLGLEAFWIPEPFKGNFWFLLKTGLQKV